MGHPKHLDSRLEDGKIGGSPLFLFGYAEIRVLWLV